MDPAAFENKVQERISASQQDILGQLENLLTRKLDTFRTEMYDSQRQLSEVQITKIVEMSSHSYSFKHKGNGEQFKINSKVVTKLQEAHSSIVERQDMVSAADKIAEVMNILKHRQELIRLVDSSDTGWKIVEENEANELAEDSDDEKRIQRAENRAQRKVKAQRQARQRRFSPYSAPRPQGPGNTAHVNTTKPTTSANNRRPGLCYACGKPGHWRIECQQQQQRNVGQGPDKISIINFPEGRVSVSNVFVLRDESESSTSVVKSAVQVARSEVMSPIGMLRRALFEWESIGVCPVVLDIIRYGYKLPLYLIPEVTVLRNNKSARENASIVGKEILSLLDKGCISEVMDKPRIVNPLTVACNTKKLRLVLDYRHVNPCLHKFRFRFEDSAVALELFRKGDFLFSFDLKSAYHHIEIFPDHREYLGFSWVFDGVIKYFVFNVLPFGLSTAGYVFSKVTRELVKYWRSQGHNVFGRRSRRSL